MKKTEFIYKIIVWGSLWGIIESTLGYILHLLPVNIGYIFWFPIAYFFMDGVYKSTKKIQSIPIIACMAATIKLLNLFMPVSIDRVINPAVSIILEGMIVFIVFIIVRNRYLSKDPLYSKAIITSIGWRLMYIIYLLFVPYWMYAISPLNDTTVLIKFLLLESVINSVLIISVIKLSDYLRSRRKVIISHSGLFIALSSMLLITINVLFALFL